MWPELSHYFGITPLNYQDLTFAELDQYLTQLAEIRKTRKG